MKIRLYNRNIKKIKIKNKIQPNIKMEIHTLFIIFSADNYEKRSIQLILLFLCRVESTD